MLFTFWNIRQTAKQYLTKNISYYKLIFTSGFINTQNDFLFFCFFGGFSCAIWILIIIYLRSYKKIVHGKSSVFLSPLKAFKTFQTYLKCLFTKFQTFQRLSLKVESSLSKVCMNVYFFAPTSMFFLLFLPELWSWSRQKICPLRKFYYGTLHIKNVP